MKFKCLFLLLGALVAVSCSQYRVYSVKQSPLMPISGGVMYALPKTLLCIDVTVEHRDVAAAPYYSYASDYLGVSDEAIDTLYHIVDIEVKGVNVADVDNYFYVDVRRGSLTVDHRHLLLAIGMDNPSDNNCNATINRSVSNPGRDVTLNGEYNLYDRVDTFYTRYDVPGHPSLVTSKKDVRSVVQRASAAAERLGEIQERMEQLLNGEYEGSYGAEAVEYIYDRLKAQEQSILSEFYGKVRRETVRFYIDPVTKRKEDFIDTVIWYSETMGFAGDEEHLPADAYPIVCEVHCDNDLRVAGRFVKYHTSGLTQKSKAGRSGSAASKSREVKGFRYRVPELATVIVSTPELSLSKDVPISQMGPVVSLPRHKIKVLFDAETLDLKYLRRR